jgi:hypothetical protein
MPRATPKCDRFAAVWNTGLKVLGICKLSCGYFSVLTSWESGRKHKG